ncbi:MAG: DUF5009 domain-containing protein [Planctomycetia bacterium]|nr:DUF5009 domain-containing protein [Planctomycetia bacterium]
METEQKNKAPASGSDRLLSLDVFRGLNMMFIMGLSGVVIAIAHCFPCSFWNTIAEQMNHVSWHGIRHHDMIFPTFLFLAGVSFPFSLAKQRSQGKSSAAIYRKLCTRALILVVLGILYNNTVSFDFANMRYASVLGHIGLAWLGAAVLFMNSRVRTQLLLVVLILVGYWLLLALVPAPDTNPHDWFTREAFQSRFQSLLHPNEQVQRGFEMEGSLVGYVDRCCLPGRLHREIHDPEGLLSLIPAIVTALLGMMTGSCIRQGQKASGRKALCLLLAGLVLTAIGYLWDSCFPINKNLWTSSFTCFVGGISMVVLAVLYYLIDVRKFRWGMWIFLVVGMNSITIYMAQRIVNFEPARDFFFGNFAAMFPPVVAELILAVGYMAVCWTFLLFLYKRKIFLKV